MNLIYSLALSTTTTFNYEPEDDVIVDWYKRDCKKNKTTAVTFPKNVVINLFTDAQKNAFNSAKRAMDVEEKKRNFMKRLTKGDASETGIVRFLTPVLMDNYGGPISVKQSADIDNALDQIRANFPIHQDNSQSDFMIPFNSAIKFNMIIRDMNPEVRQANTKEDNLTVFLKGAPEKVLKRVSKIMICRDNEITEVAYDAGARYECEAANDRFGLMGERVLAFARYDLDPREYDKTYQFDTKNWADWDMKDDMRPAGWFPLTGLTLVGLISLNDPPRPKVDVSVQKCRDAGVKVIMVTGDQPPTAAAIAHKVNIIKKPELEYNKILAEEMVDGRKITEEEAFDKCNAIVIHGDTLARVHNAEEALDDDEIEKGRKIRDWISKEEVVFARTTPSQKLLIVNACQQLGHVVAVTGDGVNDSPAIKQADIGIAMGSGSEVARNAADMLLLDDNFSSIVNGVEEGRLIFDNLKKSIAYTLSSNIPEISPFLFFMMFQIPQPLSTVLILCIDLGTDMYPAISFAYENIELDIMDRFPRNSKRDHLVNSKLISFAYLQIGIVQAAAGFFTYFYIMNDYGFAP